MYFEKGQALEWVESVKDGVGPEKGGGVLYGCHSGPFFDLFGWSVSS